MTDINKEAVEWTCQMIDRPLSGGCALYEEEFAKIKRTLRALRAELDRSEARAKVDADLIQQTAHDATVWKERAEKAEARVVELEGALRPFVRFVPDECRAGNGRYVIASVSATGGMGGGWFEADDFRRAKTAIARDRGGV